MTQEQYRVVAKEVIHLRIKLRWTTSHCEVEKRSIARSYHSAKRITARAPVTDLAGDLPAGLWGNTILGGASRLDAFSGYPGRT